MLFVHVTLCSWPESIPHMFVQYWNTVLTYGHLSPYTKLMPLNFERVQSYFTRRLLPSTHPYNNRLAKLKIDSLEERRIKVDVCMYFKILNKMIDLEINMFFKIAPDTCVTRGHIFKLWKLVNVTMMKNFMIFIIGKLIVGTLYHHLLSSPQVFRVSSPDWRKLISVGF